MQIDHDMRGTPIGLWTVSGVCHGNVNGHPLEVQRKWMSALDRVQN